MIGNFPPRRCGIATFTSDLHAAISALPGVERCDVYAMSEESLAYPDAVAMAIPSDDPAAYLEAAQRINASGAQVVSLQHEFGIFGGSAGAMLLPLLAALRPQIVTTLHTVLENPDADQRRVLQAIVAGSARIVVMVEKGREILRRVYHASPTKIVVAPHGAPDMAHEPSMGFKTKFGWTGRSVLLTFGLLSPNKGIEHMLAALPSIVKRRPNVLYVVLGATHPHLKTHAGEAYRENLVALAERLGVSRHVAFVDEFVANESLYDYLRAADIYVTPYLNEAQITSGTLAYAVALGRPVVSTPYWHARELLAHGSGVLCPFAAPAALADAVNKLLDDDVERIAISKRAYALGRETTWPQIARRYAAIFAEARKTGKEGRRVTPLRLPAVNLAGLETLTDLNGIVQHTVLCVPDRAHGYCLDDAARALILMNEAEAAGFAPEARRLAVRYAEFIQHAWNDGRGAFRNFMGFSGDWLEEQGSQDSFGRAVWALGSTSRRGATSGLKEWAVHLAGRIMPHLERLETPRARAFALLGLVLLDPALGNPAEASDTIDGFSADLLERLRRSSARDWRWFEPWLAYDNARLPEALLRVAALRGDDDMKEAALEALRWLCERQTAPEGWFRPIGSAGLGTAKLRQFDQQPLEAAATIDACRAAYEITLDTDWISEARRAYEWYLGANDLGLPVAVPDDGVCHDGLTPTGVNRNQGAESVIAFQAATCAMHLMVRERAAPATARAN